LFTRSRFAGLKVGTFCPAKKTKGKIGKQARSKNHNDLHPSTGKSSFGVPSLQQGKSLIPRGKEEESLPPLIIGIRFLQTYNPRIFADLGLLSDLEGKEPVVPNKVVHCKKFSYG
jgi:hypothetical protein